MDSGFLRGILEGALAEVTKDGDIQCMVREKIVSPMLHEVCRELYPYIYVCAGVMALVVMLLIVVTVILIGQVLRS